MSEDAMNLQNLFRLLPALLVCAAPALAAPAVADAPEPSATDHGAYLSLEFGNGRITGGNASGDQWMRGRTFEARAGRQEPFFFGTGRVDFVHYNEGHPDNNHRDGFAVEWLALRRFNPQWTGELGLGPYLSMNTTDIDGRQIDDAHLGLLISAALRYDLRWAPPGTHLRLGVNHVQMTHVHRSDALMLGIGRQFGPTTPDPADEPVVGPWWLGGSIGRSITNMAGTHGATSGTLEARRYLDGRLEHWAASARLLFEGDDTVRVDRRGAAGQLWYVQQVTPEFAMSAGIGPYVADNRREDARYDNGHLRGNLLISFQTERALSRETRVFVNFNRVKTFRETDDRDLFQLGVLKAF
jgi:hypothetical protein